MTDSFDKYCPLVAILPSNTVHLIMDIIEVTPAEQPYETLKEQLLFHYQMSEYEKLDKLFTMPDLGGRKPSAMLATMLEVCPHGEERSRISPDCFCTAYPESFVSCSRMRTFPI
jgi:hypothetical protein